MYFSFEKNVLLHEDFDSMVNNLHLPVIHLHNI